MILLLLLQAAATVTSIDNAVVTRPVVSMYSKPTGESDVVSQAIFGSSVRVLDTNGTFLRIRTPDGYEGWSESAGFVRRPPYAAGEEAATVVQLFAHLYREKSVTRHAPLVTVPFETRLKLSGEADERWVQVRLPDSALAWVQRGDILINVARLDIDATIGLSRRFLGLPYTWGGTSSYGYDCSGFTQMLQRQRGVLMPRDADDQEAWDGAAPVEQQDLQAGDLLFFGARDPKRITHTGMYIGNGEFIHATAHEKPVIQISRLDDPHWTGLFVSARRPK